MQVSALSPTLSEAESLPLDAGEDSASKSWQKALAGFVAAHSEKAPSSARPRKVDLRGWTVSDAVRRKNTVVLSFENDEEATQFLALLEKSKVD